MPSTALDIIRKEHRVFAAMLQAMTAQLRRVNTLRQGPDFPLLRALLFYIDEYPNRRHHPKEDASLFPLVRSRCPELAGVLDQLTADHQQGERSMHKLAQALLAYEVLGEPRRDNFEHALERYAAFYLRHMMLEEEHVLRAAEECCQPDELAALDRAFSANRDPFTGHDPEAEFRPVYERLAPLLVTSQGARMDGMA